MHQRLRIVRHRSNPQKSQLILKLLALGCSALISDRARKGLLQKLCKLKQRILRQFSASCNTNMLILSAHAHL